MAPADSSGARPTGPVALRIKLRYDDVDAMVQRFASNVGRSGLFLPTRSMHPVGTEVKFELRISNDAAVLVGLGKVKAAKAPDPANARAAFGLAIELMRVTRDGREIIIRMLERRRELGLPEVAIPMPEDVEAAKRLDVDTQPGVPQPSPLVDSAPLVAKPITHDTAVQPEPAPPPARPTPQPESLLTAPRPASGPVATARRQSERMSAPVLAPEPTRAKRPKLAELVAKAAELSGPVAAIELDEPDVDVGKALARARALAGGDIDVELEALRESSAAPIAIDVEAASAELARQLGGKAISRKDRSARWAPPPPIEAKPVEATPVEAKPVEAKPVEATPVEAKPIEAQPVEVQPVEVPPVEAQPVEVQPVDVQPVEVQPVETIEPVETKPVEVLEPPAPSDVDVPTEVPNDIDPPTEVPSADDDVPRRLPTASGEMDQLAQEAAMAIAERSGGAARTIERPDVEPVLPEPVIEPVVEPVPAATIESEDPELLSFERALDAARIHTGTSAPAPEREPEPAPEPEQALDAGEPDDSPDEVELDGDDLVEAEHTEIGAFAQGLAEPPPPAAYDAFEHQHPAEAADFQEEEISDLDVLAEADADDDDLLLANGERDSSGYPIARPEDYAEPAQLTPPPEEPYYEPQPETPQEVYDAAPEVTPRPRVAFVHDVFTPPPDPPAFRPLSPRDDFAARLALDEEEELPLARFPASGFEDDDADEDDPESFTMAENPDYEDPALEFEERQDFGRRGFELAADEGDAEQDVEHDAALDKALSSDPVEDLDNALSTLDVDLDKLEVPQPDRRRPAPRARPLPGMPPMRPTPTPPPEPITTRPGRALRVSDATGKPAKQTTQPLPRRRPDTDDGVIIDFDDDDDE
ncbi:MAG TPA: hypothetical protein VGL61_26625 [Kofleriaceae bacterium]